MFSDKLKIILKDKNVTSKELAKRIGKTPQAVYNAMCREGKESPKGKAISIEYRIVEEMLDALGCDIVFRDRETGQIYE